MVGFYKHDIPAWMDGTEALSDGAYRTYHVIVQLIMLNEGPIALNERGIAGRCNQAIKSFRVHLDALLKAGKLTLSDGRLSNSRAAAELQAVMKNRENAGKGGSSLKKSAQNSAEQAVSGASRADEPSIDPDKPLKNNDRGGASLDKISSLKEKRREDSPIVPKGTDRFEEFRAAYPPRNVRFQATPARKRWLEALKRGADPEQIIAGAKGYAAEQGRIGKTGTEFVKTAEVWLRNQLWNDYQPEPSAAEGKLASPDSYLSSLSDDDWRGHLRRWRSTGGQWTLANRTKPPDDPGTKVPAHLLAELGDVTLLARAS
ncbi:YdaU family protein [Methylobacterium flocculans]|uniref:YdaU family protein n=1 Tax=Methylobacterium flocculans TaxID=2984843 RepID=UPI0021F25750|nr:YdaU family protein [Methylobacterium sp. FF17]